MFKIFMKKGVLEILGRLPMLVILCVCLGMTPARAADVSMPESQVKALFLYNFAKYIDWPATAFKTPGSPIVIGLYGDATLQSDLEAIVAGKTVDGHPIVVERIKHAADPGPCHILFIKASPALTPHVLQKLKALPVLTVGESDDFIENGGMINFVMKDNKMRLAINLAAAQESNLRISSKLLGVADVVKGKSQ